eukprot:UN23646
MYDRQPTFTLEENNEETEQQFSEAIVDVLSDIYVCFLCDSGENIKETKSVPEVLKILDIKIDKPDLPTPPASPENTGCFKDKNIIDDIINQPIQSESENESDNERIAQQQAEQKMLDDRDKSHLDTVRSLSLETGPAPGREKSPSPTIVMVHVKLQQIAEEGENLLEEYQKDLINENNHNEDEGNKSEMIDEGSKSEMINDEKQAEGDGLNVFLDRIGPPVLKKMCTYGSVKKIFGKIEGKILLEHLQGYWQNSQGTWIHVKGHDCYFNRKTTPTKIIETNEKFSINSWEVQKNDPEQFVHTLSWSRSLGLEEVFWVLKKVQEVPWDLRRIDYNQIPELTITGGEAAVSGVYRITGEHNGAPVYQRINWGGGDVICKRMKNTGNQTQSHWCWEIRYKGSDYCKYRVLTESFVPPKDGWSCISGSPPAPTIAYNEIVGCMDIEQIRQKYILADSSTKDIEDLVSANDLMKILTMVEYWPEEIAHHLLDNLYVRQEVLPAIRQHKKDVIDSQLSEYFNENPRIAHDVIDSYTDTYDYKLNQTNVKR